MVGLGYTGPNPWRYNGIHLDTYSNTNGSPCGLPLGDLKVIQSQNFDIGMCEVSRLASVGQRPHRGALG